MLPGKAFVDKHHQNNVREDCSLVVLQLGPKHHFGLNFLKGCKWEDLQGEHHNISVKSLANYKVTQ